MKRRAFLALLPAVMLVRPAAAAPVPVTARPIPDKGAALVLVDSPGCAWCRRWRAEIGATYHQTTQGRAAPLSVIDIRGAWPDGVVLDRRPFMTPTFILLRDKVELARIEGYPGAAHFMPELDALLQTAGITR
ncbi:MAG: SoxS protein [Paracoccus sp. (in: a-proteobacteria)]|uniref:SoxS protein n=1 Tax=Paracoccus sp. TaxID=267 RepID=UPI0026E0FB78|nr:SoxS protein [Paracoccus sp. (in: a-proteobacteria)]MDO5620466.1 SoxS protein [Paracoccus sp. (in: a-proteobacteria)]